MEVVFHFQRLFRGTHSARRRGRGVVVLTVADGEVQGGWSQQQRRKAFRSGSPRAGTRAEHLSDRGTEAGRQAS